MTVQHPLAARAFDFETAVVANAMHGGVLTCFRETSLVTAAQMMAAERVHCLVVVATMPGGGTKLCGVLSDRDVLATAARGDLLEATAGSSARTEVVTLTPEDSLVRAAERMDDQGVTHVVVVDPHTAAPIGVLSALDIAAVVGRARPGSGWHSTRADQEGAVASV